MRRTPINMRIMDLDLTVKHVANQAGITPARLSQLSLGTRTARTEERQAIARVLKCSQVSLFGYSGKAEK